MRGKPRSSTRRSPTPRIIPAHAGQTSDYFSSEIISSDHPRACGANLIVFGVVHTHLGSSPRMRGKLEVKEFKSTATRIIPAHAGQTSTLGMTVVRPSDHPRACGANFATLVGSQLQNGSSPRMRGKRCVGRVQHPWPRIIPAHAGQTEKSHQKQWFAPDHPRACGANLPPMPAIPIAAGSSPRMRGKLTLRRRHDHCERIIPAHAGQTDLDKFYGDVNADHPRACGANPCRPPIRWMNTGSSPRMRGKLGHRHRRYGRARIIPAHAGQTRC